MKTAKIFKKSSVIWVVVASLFVVGIAYGAFLFLTQAQMSFSAQAGPQGTWTINECRIEEISPVIPGEGQIDQCEFVGADIVVGASELDNTSDVYVSFEYNNDGTVPQTLTTLLPSPLPDGVASVTEVGTNGTRSPATPVNSILIFHMDDLVAGQVVAPFTVSFEIAE